MVCLICSTRGWMNTLLGQTGQVRVSWPFSMVSTTASIWIMDRWFGRSWCKASVLLPSIQRYLVVVFGRSSPVEPLRSFRFPLWWMLFCLQLLHSTKQNIIVSDRTKFLFVDSIPESMSHCVSGESKVMADYKKLTPSGPRQLTP